MPRGTANHFNRGEVDQKALVRSDVKRINSSASLMSNFIPSRLGSMIYRPGTEYVVELDNTYDHYLIPFIAAIDDTAILDFYNDKLEFIVNDVPVEANTVTSTVTPSFTGWNDASTGSAFLDSEGGLLRLTGDGFSNAVAYQNFGSFETAVEHSLKISIKDAPVAAKIGTSGVGSTDIFKGTLKVGTHILTFTPTSSPTVTIETTKKYHSVITSMSFLTSGQNISLDTLLGQDRIETLRLVQSGDVVFFAFQEIVPTTDWRLFAVEHRGDKSWSVVDYSPYDGPFESINNTSITLSPSALSGDIIVTSSEDLFDAGDVNSLVKILSSGQKVSASISVDTGAGTNSIRVVGVGETRVFKLFVSGITTATVTLQRSADDSSWVDVAAYTVDTTTTHDDEFDNSIFYYRLFVKAGENPGLETLSLDLLYAAGSIEGVCRLTGYKSTTEMYAQVLQEFGGIDATRDWYQGSWSSNKGFPSTVDIAEGRLFFGGDQATWGSVSDAYYSFDRGIEGDSASILRTIGSGPVDGIKWIKEAGQLIIGTAGSEKALRSSSYGEVLSQNNANLKSGSNQGSSNIDAVKDDNVIYFVQRSGVKIYSLENTSASEKFVTTDANLLNQKICAVGIKRLAVVKQPESRIYALLNDGSMAVYTVDQAEEVAGWSRLSMSDQGTFVIEDIIVLPSQNEDVIYLVVNRDGDKYLEKMAKYINCVGGDVSETFDSFLRYTSPGTTITGLGHLEGFSVGVWADGQDRESQVVASGSITVSAAWTNVIVGLRYTADYISNKLDNYDKYSVLTELKRVVDTGLVLMDYWPGSLKIGPTNADMKPLPLIEDGKVVDMTATISDYSERPFDYDGDTEVDPRIHMQATGPCTILALTYDIEGDRSA